MSDTPAAIGPIDFLLLQYPEGADTGPSADAVLAPLVDALVEVLGDTVFGRDADTLAGVVLRRLTAAGATVAVAESLTGGLLGAALTELPGSSASFRGGLQVYATDVKADLAGVPEEVLAEHGAVSRETDTSCRRSSDTVTDSPPF